MTHKDIAVILYRLAEQDRKLDSIIHEQAVSSRRADARALSPTAARTLVEVSDHASHLLEVARASGPKRGSSS
jgi:hypothetical protein